MAQRIGIASPGLWRIRDDVERLTGMKPAPLLPVFGRLDAIAGWGHKPTAARARTAARRRGLSYIAIEDGFLRGVRPGGSSRSLSYVVDRQGIYYDRRSANALQSTIETADALPVAEFARARAAIEFLTEHRLSKYNDAPLEDSDLPEPAGGFALVVDQSVGDASIEGAGAGPANFRAALAAAVAEHGRDRVLVKTHPDNRRAGVAGHLGPAARELGVAVWDRPINPHTLFRRCRAVYAVSSLMGFEALMHDLPVACFGRPFYSGWGLTDDRASGGRQPMSRSLEQVFAAAYFGYSRYFDPYDRAPIAFEEAADRLLFLRDRFHENSPRFVTVGFSAWKQRATRPFLDGPHGPPLNVRTLEEGRAVAARIGGQIAVWGAAPAASEPESLARIEDGFIRSRGLGAALAYPASLIVDPVGIYFDPRAPSRFEEIAETAEFDDELLARAAALRHSILSAAVTKYNVGRRAASLPDSGGRKRILVVGQVEDDASIRFGSPLVSRNIDLLREARARHPDAFIVYKPHPDVEARVRSGASAASYRDVADHVASGESIVPLLDWCDRLETMTSLAGFEALLRGKSVGVHGGPFYAGWGLTDDRMTFPRRSRRLTLDMLVAAALILYPRYVDPATRIPCQPELVVRRLSADARVDSGLALRRALGGLVGRLLNVARGSRR